MRGSSIFLSLAMSCNVCFAQGDFPLSEVTFQRIFGQRAGETVMYSLLGNGFIRTIRSDDEEALIAEWRRQHPHARAVPVAIAGENSRRPVVYLWAVDGKESLNLFLVEKGVYPGSVMLDAVDADRRTKGSAQRANIEAGAAYARKLTNAAPVLETPPRRLIADSRYAAFVQQLGASERSAKAKMNGVWSDKFKDLRETEGVAPVSSLR